MALLSEEPPGTGDEHWDVLLAALAEHLAARADAVVHAPAAFRRRGVFIAPQELEGA